MASITVDVNLEDFDLDELLEEVEDRYNYTSGKYNKQIEEWVKVFFDIESHNNNVRLSLLDQMKIDFLIRNLDKIKLNDLENLI